MSGPANWPFKFAGVHGDRWTARSVSRGRRCSAWRVRDLPCRRSKGRITEGSHQSAGDVMNSTTSSLRSAALYWRQRTAAFRRAALAGQPAAFRSNHNTRKGSLVGREGTDLPNRGWLMSSARQAIPSSIIPKKDNINCAAELSLASRLRTGLSRLKEAAWRQPIFWIGPPWPSCRKSPAKSHQNRASPHSANSSLREQALATSS